MNFNLNSPQNQTNWRCKTKDKFRIVGLSSILIILILVFSLTIVQIYDTCPRIKGCKYVVYNCQPFIDGSELCSFEMQIDKIEHCNTKTCSGTFCQSTCLQNNPWTDGSCPRNGSNCDLKDVNDG